MDYDTVLDLPLKVFSFYNVNISRLRAEEDIRLLSLLASANNSDNFKSTFDRLERENGEPIKEQPKLVVKMEEGALDKLRNLGG